MCKVARDCLIELGIGYEDISKKCSVETLNKHTKRLNQKSAQENRKAAHGKLLYITVKKNKTFKKNKPGELAMKKGKRSV